MSRLTRSIPSSIFTGVSASVFASVCTTIALLGMATIACAGSGHPDHLAVRAALESRGHATHAHPAAAATPKPSALLAFSMRGTATASDPADGTCSGGTCTASSGDCECIMFQGSLTATEIGNSTWTGGVTVNTDDCTNTGTTTSQGGGFCCFGDGTLTATATSSSSNALAMSFTGNICDDPNASDDLSVQAGYIIVTDSSSGKFKNSAGTGQINLFLASDNTTYLAGNGVLQVISPF
jgi:hypothetical protein